MARQRTLRGGVRCLALPGPSSTGVRVCCCSGKATNSQQAVRSTSPAASSPASKTASLPRFPVPHPLFSSFPRSLRACAISPPALAPRCLLCSWLLFSRSQR
eukprot:3934814-Rhodomonas_salina.5